MADTLYRQAVEILKDKGGEVVLIKTPEIALPKFVNLLNLDMQKDLPNYFENYADKTLPFDSVQDVIDYNKKDSLNKIENTSAKKLKIYLRNK